MGAQTDDRSLRLYSWPDYTGSSTLADFAASSGISVSANFYDNSDEMLRTISEADHRYDIIIASYDYIEEMIGKELLLPLDPAKS